ncbi:shikimate dehydrogenase family protein [Comamonas sp. J-3]|uniref:shikimate dehydrogenase family protein n=1 Tax=Comamonas trifloxystrobinivorans TaxID=3350256 RepID=UPI00372781EE
MICGTTSLIAHIGYPTFTFKSPQIYNPYFQQAGIDAVVVPMGCQAPDYAAFLRAVFTLTNIAGALITMPHKVSTVALLDEASVAVQIAGACNAVRRSADGRLQGDLFDGEGFVRGVQRKGLDLSGQRALVVGSGGVGSAIAASLAAAGVAQLQLFDVRPAVAEQLAVRLRQHYPQLQVSTGSKDPAEMDLVVNATPLGMQADDPLPIDVQRLRPGCMVGEVVLRTEMTALLLAAQQRGCLVQVGSDMLFEQIPAYLEFFGLPSTTPEQLRAVAQLG